MSISRYLPYGSTWAFVLGVISLGYGSSAFMYKRWDHEYNKHVQPAFHPWAIALGVLLIWIAVRKPKRHS
jgi:tryptophan-rich sensory protein